MYLTDQERQAEVLAKLALETSVQSQAGRITELEQKVSAGQRLAKCAKEILSYPFGVMSDDTYLGFIKARADIEAAINACDSNAASQDTKGRIADLEERLRAVEESAIRKGWDLDTANADIIRLSGRICELEQELAEARRTDNLTLATVYGYFSQDKVHVSTKQLDWVRVKLRRYMKEYPPKV